MKRVLLALTLVALLVVPLSAAYAKFEAVPVANAAIGLTAANLTASGGHPQANWAECRLETAEIRYTVDGTTPTSTVGTLLEVGDVVQITGNDNLLRFLAIRTGASSGQLDCHEYEVQPK